MLRRRAKGQTTLEYVMLVIILIGALIAMQHYMKRGIMGRWKASVDDVGQQYDPRFGNTDYRHTIVMAQDTVIFTVDEAAAGGYWTRRLDMTNSVERKRGFRGVGYY